MIRMKAIKGFVGKSGEGRSPDNLVRRHDVLLVDKSRAAHLRRTGLAIVLAREGEDRKEGPTPSNKNKQAPGNKSGGLKCAKCGKVLKTQKGLENHKCAGKKEAGATANPSEAGPTGGPDGDGQSSSASQPGLAPQEPPASASSESGASEGAPGSLL
ncbi:hypothetical protein [Parvibaculum sp. MBR-TMA-1.3b-4.2]|jgi:hypothetical protein